MRRTPLKRKTPLRSNPETIRAWKQRTARNLPQRSAKRAKQERAYHSASAAFLADHPICPVTGGKTTQIHHSAKRFGEWLNLKRYWIAVSGPGHQFIEDNKTWAEQHRLMVRIYETYAWHVAQLAELGIDLNVPVFYHPDLS